MGTPKEPLDPKDFPVEADGPCVKRRDGQVIAETETEDMAHEVADRLNSDEHRREEDRWSA